jgi:hypothetical protein
MSDILMTIMKHHLISSSRVILSLIRIDLSQLMSVNILIVYYYCLFTDFLHAILFHELVVGTAFCNFTVMYDQYPIAHPHHSSCMSHHDHYAL